LKDQVIVWIGAGIAQEWLEDAFGVTSLQDIQAELPVLTLEANMALNAAIQECWKISQRYLTVSIIPQGDPREVIFKEILVEDSTASGAVFTEWRKRVGGIFM
jgi:hypothetical protein